MVLLDRSVRDITCLTVQCFRRPNESRGAYSVHTTYRIFLQCVSEWGLLPLWPHFHDTGAVWKTRFPQGQVIVYLRFRDLSERSPTLHPGKPMVDVSETESSPPLKWALSIHGGIYVWDCMSISASKVGLLYPKEASSAMITMYPDVSTSQSVNPCFSQIHKKT